MPKREDISKLGQMSTGDENWNLLKEILSDIWDKAFLPHTKVVEVKEKEKEKKKENKKKK